jgi:hypothetical protein
MTRFPRTLVLVAAFTTAALALAACGDDDGGGVRTIDGGSGTGSASGSPSGPASGSPSGPAAECEPVGADLTATTEVAVTLGEWFVRVDRARAPTGVVRFQIANDGADAHELVVVRGAPDALARTEDGALDVDALPDGALVGEVEPFPGGADCAGAFRLEPGEYSLVCDVVEDEDGETVAHLAEGMVTAFTVT